MSNTHRTEQLNIALADWSEPACRAAMVELVGCVRSNDEVSNLDVSFVVAGRALDHGEFFRHLVATGFDLSPEYGILAEIYLDGPWHFSFGTSSNATRQEEADARGWRHRLARTAIQAVGLPDEQMISLLLSNDEAGPLQAGLARAAARQLSDKSTRIYAKFRDEILLNLHQKQGWRTVASIKLALERSLCECDGNPIYLRPGLMKSASRLLSARALVELVTDRASNLPWRVSGCETWKPATYLTLLRETLDLSDAYQREVAVLLPPRYSRGALQSVPSRSRSGILSYSPGDAAFAAAARRLVEARTSHGRKVDNRVWSVAFSPDGRNVVSCSNDSTPRLWEVANGSSRDLKGHSGWVRAAAFSPDGRHVVSGSEDRTVRLWEVASGTSHVLDGHAGIANVVAFSPDGRYVLSGSDDHTLRVFSVAGGKARELKGHDGGVTALAFSPDGRHVASGCSWGKQCLWEVASGTSRKPDGFGHIAHSVTALAFSPNGRYVASSSSGRTLFLWEVASGALRALNGHTDAVFDVAFSPDGRHLVSGSADRTLRLWDVASGDSRALKGHQGWVNSVAFTPDGQHVVSASQDRTLGLWEVASGQEIARLAGDDPFASPRIAADGKRLVAGGRRVHLIDMRIDGAEKAASRARS